MSLTNDVGLGYVRVDEDFLGVWSIALVRDGLRVVARRFGPAPAVSGAYRLFTAEGEPVTDGASGPAGSVAIPELRHGQVYNFTMTITFDHVNGHDATLGRVET